MSPVSKWRHDKKGLNRREQRKQRGLPSSVPSVSSCSILFPPILPSNIAVHGLMTLSVVGSAVSFKAGIVMSPCESAWPSLFNAPKVQWNASPGLS